MTSSEYDLRSRYLTIDRSPLGLSLTFEPLSKLAFGSKQRAEEARRRILGLLKSHRVNATAEGEIIRATIPPHAMAGLRDLVFELDAALDAFGEERLHPRVVEEMLGITAHERRRWTKDRRLPTSGWGSFRRSQQSIQFPLYPAAKIAALAQRPETIESWRREDGHRGI
jgi:hypothetical protein